MRSKKLSGPAGMLLCIGLAGATTAAVLTSTDDYRTLPPPHDEIETQLRDAGVTLREAVEAAQAVFDGRARAAEFIEQDDRLVVLVELFGGGEARRVRIDAASGEVAGVFHLPRLPGRAFEGDLTEHESGVQYADIEVGEGPAVESAGITVSVHYTAYLVDGTAFDSTDDRGEPASLALRNVFPGMARGVEGMRVGGTRKIIIPPELGFGAQQVHPAVPANATLIFDVELLDIVDYESVPDELPGEPVDVEPVELDDNLVIYDLEVGDGDVLNDVDETITIHYTGYLTDASSFDSSRQRGEPMTTPLANLIPGWQQGLLGMREGGTRKLVIPYPLAYGESGRPPTIPPRATLIFDIELVEIASE